MSLQDYLHDAMNQVTVEFLEDVNELVDMRLGVDIPIFINEIGQPDSEGESSFDQYFLLQKNSKQFEEEYEKSFGLFELLAFIKAETEHLQNSKQRKKISLSPSVNSCLIRSAADDNS
jgi:hypothetical protein